MANDMIPGATPGNRTYRYEATVNGKRRYVIFVAPRGLTLDVIEHEWIDNHDDTYKRFYRGAKPEDFEAEREDSVAYVMDWSEVEQ